MVPTRSPYYSHMFPKCFPFLFPNDPNTFPTLCPYVPQLFHTWFPHVLIHINESPNSENHKNTHHKNDSHASKSPTTNNNGITRTVATSAKAPITRNTATSTSTRMTSVLTHIHRNRNINHNNTKSQQHTIQATPVLCREENTFWVQCIHTCNCPVILLLARLPAICILACVSANVFRGTHITAATYLSDLEGHLPSH